MINFKPDVEKLKAELSSTPLEVSTSDKGQVFKTWWYKNYQAVEDQALPVLDKESGGKTFDRRVDLLRIIENIDNADTGDLVHAGFTSSEKTSYATRALNKRLKRLGWVVRNNAFVPLQIEDKS